MARQATYTVTLSVHARERLVQYTGTARGAAAAIARALVAVLRIGVVPNEELGITVLFRGGYRAVCYPRWEGGWVVATVMPPKGNIAKFEDVDQLAESR